MTVHRARWLRRLLLVPVLLLPMAAAAGGEGSDARSESVRHGELLYRIHCLNCHGDAGRGGGPMEEVLTVSPGDLSRLAARHGGEFPADEVRMVVDGRDLVRGHGMREMPVWGLTFQIQGTNEREEDVQARIDDLIAYLESIQR